MNPFEYAVELIPIMLAVTLAGRPRGRIFHLAAIAVLIAIQRYALSGASLR